MVEGDKLYPIEIKKGKAPLHPDKNFKALDKLKMDVQPGVIICMSDELIPLHRGAWYFPAAAL